MYSTTQLLGATVLLVASTAQAQTLEQVLTSHAPAGYSIAGTLSGTATPQVDAAAAIRITGERALLGEVDSRARPATPATFTDPPIDGSLAHMGQWPSALPVAPRGVEKRSSFRAEIRGAVATSASGDAEFGAVQDPDRSPGAFVVSLGVRSDQGAILFTRMNGTPLGVGRYRIAEAADGGDEILALILTGSASRPTGVFRGQSGWLIVTEASERLLAGWFQIDGVGFRAAEPERDDRRVSATGSFSAAVARETGRRRDRASADGDLGDRTQRRGLTPLNITDTVLFMAMNTRLASAVHIMSFVAYAGDEGTTSEAIAKSLQTNPVVVRKILKLLEREGLVALRQGRLGGVGLRHPASGITLGQIYKAVENETGVLAMRSQVHERCVVARAMKRRLGPIFNAANDAVEQALSKTSLAELVRGVG